MEIAPTEENSSELKHAEVNLKMYIHVEEYQRQKARIKWFSDRDKNTKFFNTYVKGKRKKMQISKIQTKQGDIITTTQNIKEEAVNIFRESFMETIKPSNYDMIECILYMVIDEKNRAMEKIPIFEKVKIWSFTLMQIVLVDMMDF